MPDYQEQEKEINPVGLTDAMVERLAPSLCLCAQKSDWNFVGYAMADGHKNVKFL